MPMHVYVGSKPLRRRFFFQAEDGIRGLGVTGVQTCALPISTASRTGPLVEASTLARSSQAASMVRARSASDMRDLGFGEGRACLATAPGAVIPRAAGHPSRATCAGACGRV